MLFHGGLLVLLWIWWIGVYQLTITRSPCLSNVRKILYVIQMRKGLHDLIGDHISDDHIGLTMPFPKTINGLMSKVNRLLVSFFKTLIQPNFSFVCVAIHIEYKVEESVVSTALALLILRITAFETDC